MFLNKNHYIPANNAVKILQEPCKRSLYGMRTNLAEGTAVASNGHWYN